MKRYLAGMLVVLSAMAMAIMLPSIAKVAAPQTTSSTVELDATLSPANETPAITTAPDSQVSGSAKVIFTLTKDSSGNIMSATAEMDFTLNNFPAAEVAILAHVHEGAAGVAGPVRINTGITPTAALTPTNGTITFSTTGISVSPDTAVAIFGNPAGWYFNVHSDVNKGGAARGQLVLTPQEVATATFATHLLPANEVPPVTNADSGISGDVIVILSLTKDSTGTIVGASSEFDWTLNNVPASDQLILSHVHNAAVGVNGPVRIGSLLSPTNFLTPTNGTVVLSETGLTTSPSVATDMIANTANYYFNCHSNVNPGGCARGQLDVAPVITSVTVDGKNLDVNGTGFAAGAQVSINGSAVVTKQPKNQTTLLIAKKAAKHIASGQTVVVVVQLADNTKGPGFNFLKP